jgi:hypothetical protein
LDGVVTVHHACGALVVTALVAAFREGMLVAIKLSSFMKSDEFKTIIRK